MEWRNTKKLGSLLRDYEDMRRRIQLSNNRMESVNKIWPQQRLNINQKLNIYKTIVKSILTYNYLNWRLTQAQIKELDRAHRKQLRKLRNVPVKKNRYVYRDTMEIPLSIEMKKAKWRTFGHMLRSHKKVPCQIAMTDYFQYHQIQEDILEEKRCTPPVKIDKDLKEAKRNNNLTASKSETEDLQKLRNIAKERSEWTKFSSLICRQAEDENQ